MGTEEVERIKQKFTALHLHPIYREHAPAVTSEEASKNRGDALKQGIKALLFTNKQEFVIVNIHADQKVDQKKVKSRNTRNSKNTLKKSRLKRRSACSSSAPIFRRPTSENLYSPSVGIESELYCLR